MFRSILMLLIFIVSPIEFSIMKAIDVKVDNNSDLILLTRLINSESHGESKLDKLLVASVVLNRVHSNEFPNTIRDVIYQRNQFSGINSALFRFNESNPYDVESYNAARIVLEYGPVERGIIFFLNPVISTNREWVQTVSKRELAFKSKNHVFYY